MNNLILKCFELPEGRAEVFARDFLRGSSYALLRHLHKYNVSGIQKVLDQVFVKKLYLPNTSSINYCPKNYVIICAE